MKQLKKRLLEGSCQCGQVQFDVESDQYYPYQLCYCGICRKSAGGGGFAINLSADHRTLTIHNGRARIKILHARVKNPEDKRAHRSSGERHYCRDCGTFLWVYDRDYPDLMHPFASCIDTALPKPPERTHMMLEFKAPWVEPDFGAGDKRFKRYPKESIQQWHERVILNRRGTKAAASRRG